MNQEQQYSLDRIREFIQRCKWVWAKTYLDIPHEYIARYKCALKDDEFLYFCHAQRDLGVHERWGNYNHPYLYIDGYKYWTMGDTYENTTVMNRQKVFTEFSTVGFPIPQHYSDAQAAVVVGALLQFGNKPIFEIGCGNGNLIDLMQLTPANYYGCDPCRENITDLKGRHIGFSKCATIKPFEELRPKWLAWEGLIVCTFGTASYLMEPYLKMIPNSKADYFLMFYKEGFCPEPFRFLHHFTYSAEQLRAMFPQAYINPTKDYYVVSSKPIDWDKALHNRPIKQQELFE
jgi:hypothetical protein